MRDGNHPQGRAKRGGVTRREVLGYGLGAAALSGAGCGLGPDVCGAGAPPLGSPSEQDTAGRAPLAPGHTLIVVMLENRSFDHLLGSLSLDRDYAGAARVAGITGEECNPDRDGNLVPIARLPGDGSGSMNPEHDWRSVQASFNSGKNDGFV